MPHGMQARLGRCNQCNASSAPWAGASIRMPSIYFLSFLALVQLFAGMLGHASSRMLESQAAAIVGDTLTPSPGSLACRRFVLQLRGGSDAGLHGAREAIRSGGMPSKDDSLTTVLVVYSCVCVCGVGVERPLACVLC